jgi:hypothetical protein
MTEFEKIAQYEENIEKIEAVLTGKAESDIKSYEIAGRSLEKHSISELIQLAEYYKAEIKELRRLSRPRKLIQRVIL